MEIQSNDKIPLKRINEQAWEEGGANVKLHFPEVSVPKAHACAAHIFARRWGRHMPKHLDMEDVNSPTNALVLMKPIEVYTPLSLVSICFPFSAGLCNLPAQGYPPHDWESKNGS